MLKKKKKGKKEGQGGEKSQWAFFSFHCEADM